MTYASLEINRVPAGVNFILNVQGHAGYAKEGVDVVCAGVSMLVQALAAALIAMKPLDAPMIYTCNEEQAEATVWFVARDTLEAERAEAMYQVAMAGISLLEKNYPENVCVTGATEKNH